MSRLKRQQWINIRLFCLALLCLFHSAFAVQFKNLRVSRSPHHWLLILDATGPVKYHEFHLKHPDRAVFDFANVSYQQAFPRVNYVNTPVTKIRMHHHRQHLRMVLDLDHPVSVKSFTLKPMQRYGYRLVIDIKGQPLKVVGFNWPKKKSNPIQHKRPMIHVITHSLKPLITSTRVTGKQRPIVVVIDPGHGGKDPGATGIHGYHEKDIVLAISKDLQRDINRLPGFKAILTRRGDYFISLRGRLAIARKDKADMFVAIHADAYQNHTATGVSVFALSQRGATSEAAHWLAARENQSELMGGVDLSDKGNLLKSVLISLSQTATVRASLQIGEDLIRNIGHFTHLHHGRVEQAAFVVLKSPDIPSLLVETGFISNPIEERRLISPAYQQVLAHAIAGGIDTYFVKQPPRGTWLAAQQQHTQNHRS